MAASKENPEYTVCLILEDGTVLELTPVITDLNLSHQREQLAQCVTLTLANAKYRGRWITSIFHVRQRVFVYADDGERHEEVFRGFLWSIAYTFAVPEREIVLRCYDNLIFWQESEVSEFFPKGKSTQAVLTALFDAWGIPMRWAYQSITHDKLALRGNLADLVTSDILDKVKKQTGAKYAIVMEQETAVIRTAGDNESRYRIEGDAHGAIQTKTDVTMEDMVTKVLILGKAGDDKRTPVEATVTGDVALYGTLQKLQDREEKTSLADAKKEAQATIDEKGKPRETYELKAVDIPWIRKGDRISVSVGGIWQKELIVWGLDRGISNREKTMTLTMEEATA